MLIGRRRLLGAGAAAALSNIFPRSVGAEEPDSTLSLDTVAGMAQVLAAKPYQGDADPLPPSLRDLDYSRFRGINFRSDQAFWRSDGDFRVELFHRGFQYDRKVAISLVEAGEIRELDYSPDLFDFAASGVTPNFSASLGFAGFRPHHPLNRPDYFDEFAVFLGGSYFRLIGRGQHYGASARGLAIDTAETHGEEFPWFTRFWIVRPESGARSVEIYALLDSKSTTGAYRFVVEPGAGTRAAVEALLFPRVTIHKPGLGVLTSMFLHGGTGNRPFADLRPQLHDSDGLSIATGTGERLWRPLVNPRTLRISSFSDRAPRGYGLLQRDRAFQDYLDPDEHYQDRPGLWVEPRDEWALGRVELVEIPSGDEINDNIVAYWVPPVPIEPQTPFAFAYDIRTEGTGSIPGGGRCIGTRIGPARAVDAAAVERGGAALVWADFADGELPGLAAEQPVEAVVTSSSGRIEEVSCRKLEPGSWRAAFLFRPDGSRDAELRLFLRFRGQTLSETWTYRWTAE
jgi:glucans biosynthesis protein